MSTNSLWLCATSWRHAGVRSDGSRWALEGFKDAIEAWVYNDFPDDELRWAVVNWIVDQAADPYRGMSRDGASANLWFGAIPGTQRGLDSTTCLYWILERERTVQADPITTMTWVP